jgi:hypothetical protein
MPAHRDDCNSTVHVHVRVRAKVLAVLALSGHALCCVLPAGLGS